MNLLKNFRITFLILLLIIFTYFLISPYILKKSGVVVTAVDKSSKCGNIREGDVITAVLASSIRNSEDFKAVEKAIKANEYATMVVNNGPGGCAAVRDGYSGLSIADMPSNELKFGIDIQGGVTTVLKPEKELNKTEIENIARILNKRIGVYGLPETTAGASNSLVKINSLSSEKINWLIAAGEFEAKILEDVKLQNDIGKIPVGDNSYSVELANDSLKINNSAYRINDEFELEDIKFKVRNVTNASAVVEATFFENKDIVKVLSGSSVKYNADTQAYEFTIPVEISAEASNRFTKIVKRIQTTIAGKNIILNGFLVYYLDGNHISQLSIPIEFARQTVKQLSLIGFSTNMADASNTRLKILSAIESGVLSTNLEIVKTEKYEPKLRDFSIEIFGYALGLAVISVLSIFYWRYKNLSLSFLAIVLVLLGLALVLGAIATAQQLTGISWIVNLRTIAGFIAVLIISSVQIMISSERILKKKELSVSYKQRKLIKASAAFNWSVLIIGFLFLFTAWRFLGLTLLTGFVFNVLFTIPIYSNFIKKRFF
jgi:hypothetical protein